MKFVISFLYHKNRSGDSMSNEAIKFEETFQHLAVIRGDSSISQMTRCGPNALPKNWIWLLQSVACI